VLGKAGLKLSQIDVIELNEAFAAQALAVTRDLGLPDDAAHVNPNGGAIAIGHPLGASGARLTTAAVNQLERIQGRYALCTMCIGVGQGSIDLGARLGWARGFPRHTHSSHLLTPPSHERRRLNEVLECHCKIDFWVVGKSWKEAVFEDDDEERGRFGCGLAAL
jgi:hypothetical protein